MFGQDVTVSLLEGTDRTERWGKGTHFFGIYSMPCTVSGIYLYIFSFSPPNIMQGRCCHLNFFDEEIDAGM